MRLPAPIALTIVMTVLGAGMAVAQQDAPDTTLASPLGTAFTYQGQMQDAGDPANGSYDLQLTLFDAVTVGNQVGSPVTLSAVAVSDGLFTVTPDFGVSVAGSSARWLQIAVRPHGSTGAYTTLVPRQRLTPVPTALYASSAIPTGAAGGSLAGSYPNPSIATGAVTQATLSAGSATPNQVLSTDGTNLLWKNASGGVGGTGTAGQVAFWVGASTLSGSSSLYWSNASGRLGLGTTTPAEQLELTGNLRLPATTASVGRVVAGDFPFMHSYGTDNTFLGSFSGNFTLTGGQNTGIGDIALANLTSGADNTATGASALMATTTGGGNSGMGSGVLTYNTAGTFNSAVGYFALHLNTTAGRNTAVGVGALFAQDFANGGAAWDANNTAVGYEALNQNNPTNTSTGVENTAVGAWALKANTTGAWNTATGYKSLDANTTGAFNAAFGHSSLAANTLGAENTGVGSGALGSNSTGAENAAFGYGALFQNQTADRNTALGWTSMNWNTTGTFNTAIGAASLVLNTTASRNTAVGADALGAQGFDNGQTPWNSDNTAVGYQALRLNQPTADSNGVRNTAVGAFSLAANTTGLDNTALGVTSLSSNQTGFANTAVGVNAMVNNNTGNWNVAVGGDALRDNTSGGGNIAIGHSSAAGFNGNNQLFIGNGLGTLIWGDIDTKRVAIGMTGGSYQLQLATDSAGKPGGGSWANTSDARLKRDIHPLEGALDRLLRLRGVSFAWVHPAAHGGHEVEQGFLAQDVARVFPEWVQEVAPQGEDARLVGPGEGVLALTLPFAFDATLVEAIREQQALIEGQRAELAALRAEVAALKVLVTNQPSGR